MEGKGSTDSIRLYTQRELSAPAGVGVEILLFYVGTLQSVCLFRNRLR